MRIAGRFSAFARASMALALSARNPGCNLVPTGSIRARIRTQAHLVGTWPIISWNACKLISILINVITIICDIVIHTLLHMFR